MEGRAFTARLMKGPGFFHTGKSCAGASFPQKAWMVSQKPRSGRSPKWPFPSFQVLNSVSQKQVPLKRCYLAGFSSPLKADFDKQVVLINIFRGRGHRFLWSPKTGSPDWQKEPDKGPE
jgi:hypothetical protein